MKIKTQVKYLWWWKTISTTIKWEINIEETSHEGVLYFIKRQMNHAIGTHLEIFNFGYFVNITNPKPGLITLTRRDKQVRIIVTANSQLTEMFISYFTCPKIP